ncbi:hypothetical protein PPACK8108_LOCUS21251 [Phakopsora pachyrhizi]|uniref:Uncharacterized protein n=1 Tax=Phakopsora pachyrhizi TaxID=170000 RepID=A0AAV0BKA8_PHAPC|nr:hypothetical protein PPACK8108_LOCUS21251 [Phakopsora pachyrhizi]
MPEFDVRKGALVGWVGLANNEIKRDDRLAKEGNDSNINLILFLLLGLGTAEVNNCLCLIGWAGARVGWPNELKVRLG